VVPRAAAKKYFFAVASLEARRGLCYFGGVFFRKNDKPRERFYLFPGQGGSNYRQKQRRIMRWTVAVSLLLAAALAAVLWLLSKPKP